MPRYHFDLVGGDITADQGGLVLRDDADAIEVGEPLAKILYDVRPELRSRRCAILVRNEKGEETYRALIEEQGPSNPKIMGPDHLGS